MLFGFVFNLPVFTALINPAASLEVLSASLNFSKQFQLPQFNLSVICHMSLFLLHLTGVYMLQGIFYFS